MGFRQVQIPQVPKLSDDSMIQSEEHFLLHPLCRQTSCYMHTPLSTLSLNHICTDAVLSILSAELYSLLASASVCLLSFSRHSLLKSD